MKLPFILYLISWLAATLLALTLLWRHAGQIELFRRGYLRQLLQPWKIVTFLVAAIGMGVLAPYSGDPTWDYVDVAFMSLLTFFTAPWVIAMLYFAARRETTWLKLYLAICSWMFSASWSYDLYILLRDGYYPLTWLPNIFASSVLYLSAGLMWSLEWQKGRGVVFGFMLKGWPEQEVSSPPRSLYAYALVFVVMVVALMTPFFI